jgi:hypothetical protein
MSSRDSCSKWPQPEPPEPLLYFRQPRHWCIVTRVDKVLAMFT